MKKKEIDKKFEELEKQIKSLEQGQEDLYEICQLLLATMKKYTDEPIFHIKYSPNWEPVFPSKDYVLQFAYENRVKEIRTGKDIRIVELFAYCDTHFILKNHADRYFLVDMEAKTLTEIPAQLLLSKEINLNIEGQTLKICQETGVIGIRRNTDD